MTLKPWKVLESTRVREWFRVDRCELPNGKFLDAMIFEFRPWVSVLAMTKDREVVLIRQYRHGVQEVLWEFPGGVVEDGESPFDGAKRELLEETGYASTNIMQVGRLYPNPAIQTEIMYSFVALDAERVGLQALDEAEDIEVHLVPLDELMSMAKRGDFPHALQIAVLFQALAYLDRIK